MGFMVTEKAQRPANMNGRCFYCGQAIGEPHKDDCVLIKKKVKVRMIVEYEISVPARWEQDSIEFHRNDSSWCADNALQELDKLIGDDKCLCPITEFQYVGGDSEPFLDEG